MSQIYSINTITDLDQLQAKLGQNHWFLLDFTAAWCGPCRRMEPVFKQIAKDKPEICCCKVDIDSAGQLASKFHVANIPYFVLLANGQVVDSMAGASPDKLLQLVSRCTKFPNACNNTLLEPPEDISRAIDAEMHKKFI